MFGRLRLARASLVASVAVSAMGAGCGELTTVKVPSEQEVSVPGQGILAGNPLVDEQVFPSDVISEALAQSISQTFDTAGYDKDAVDSIKLTKLSMTVTNPEEGGRQVRGLGFIEKLTINVSADGVDPIVVAESAEDALDGSPGPVSYDMPLTEAELVEAFKAGDQMTMDADLEPGPPPQFETDVLFETELTIQVNVAGALF
jgi:hypothetical protein